MPGGAARFEPFFRYLPNLSIAEKAAAVHLGIFPENAAARVAQAPATTPPPRTVTGQHCTPSSAVPAGAGQGRVGRAFRSAVLSITVF